MSDEKRTDDAMDPSSVVEKAFLLGIGVLEMTKEKAQEFANDLIEKGKVSQSDAKKVADKFSELADEQQKTLRKTVATETDKVLKTTGVATKAEMDELKAQIAELKEMLASAHNPSKPAAE